ncbi:MAG: 4-hydroxythreonine-4-phosphate dehydrogenase PdxA [Longimicrobiales bacterium]
MDRSVGAQSRPAERLRIAISLGDPRGIGPEVTEKALQRVRQIEPSLHVVAIGSVGHVQFPLADQSIDVGPWSGDAESAGRVAGLSIERAAHLALLGQVDALVTAPVDKSALRAAGYGFPGQTEMLAHLSGRASVAMMMCAEQTKLGGSLRVVLATTHLPLARVPTALTTQLLVEQARLTHAALRDSWGITQPRLAVCALNPHASDGGLFGDEEERLMRPGIDQLRREGIRVWGPIPADTVFVRAIADEFDAVIAPYHDVGMAAFKTASFGRGVNVTLGLPFPRTSPDHGTALDIAGRGVADASSMLEAVELAIRLALSQPITSHR